MMRKLNNGRVLHGDPNPAGTGTGTGTGTEGTPAAGLTEAGVTSIIASSLKKFQETHLAPLGDLTTQFKAFLESQKPPVATPPANTEPKGAADPHVNSEIQSLRRDLEKATKAQTDFQQQAKDAQAKTIKIDTEQKVRNILNTFDFVDAEAREDAFELVSKKITREDDGTLLGPGNLTAEAWLQDFIPSKKGHLLNRQGPNGSGAAPATNRPGGKRVSFEDIKPGMSPEALQEVSSAIVQAFGPNR